MFWNNLALKLDICADAPDVGDFCKMFKFSCDKTNVPYVRENCKKTCGICKGE